MSNFNTYDIGGERLVRVGEPTNADHAATKNYVDTSPASVPPGGTTGQVLTKASDADGDADWESGGGSVGTPIVRGPFAFAFDTPNIDTGVPVYTPAIGDLLIDAWVVVNEVWDDGAAVCDIGRAQDVGAGGLFNQAGSKPFLATADGELNAGDGMLTNNSNPQLAAASATHGYTQRVAPLPFTTADPLLLWVVSGASVNGAAQLYIVTATPVPLP